MNDAADRLPWTTGAQIATLEAEVARLTQERTEAINQSMVSLHQAFEAMKMLKAAEARLAALTAVLEGLERSAREWASVDGDRMFLRDCLRIVSDRLAALRTP